MANITYPKFGASKGFQSLSQAKRYEPADVATGGNQTVDFIKNGQMDCYVIESTCHWGIDTVAWRGVTILDSILLSVSDEILPEYIPNPLNTVPNGNGELIPVDMNKPFVVLDCCKIQKGHVSLKISGKGEPSGIQIGDIDYPSPLRTATQGGGYSAFSVDALLNTIDGLDTTNKLKIISIDINEENTSWNTFTIEYRKTISGNMSGSSIANQLMGGVVIPCSVVGFDGYSFCESYTYECGLLATDYAHTKLTKTLHLKKP